MTSLVSSAATTQDLYAALHPVGSAEKAAMAQATAAAGAMSFADLYAKLASETTNSPESLDGHVLSGGLAHLAANREAILALGKEYPTLRDWWAHERNDPMSISAEALQADVAALARAHTSASLSLASLRAPTPAEFVASKQDPAPGWQKCADANELTSNVGLLVAGVCTPFMFVPNELVKALVQWPCVTWDSISMATWAGSSACKDVHDLIAAHQAAAATD